ncbi:MAG: alginate export family protein [Planctomycetota bacterium]|nr:alginate export family protein [Planctomycetota bacterium]
MKSPGIMALVLGMAGSAFGQTTIASPAPVPPAYTPVRYNEDYSYLRDPARRTDFFDPIKYIPLNDKGDWYASFGGEVRDRYELFSQNLFGAVPQDHDGYNLVRVLADADLHLGQYLRVFAQGISATEQFNDLDPRPTDVDQINLEQAFVDLKLPLADKSSLTLRGGRQNLLFGAQRLIGPLDWTNDRRTFDGFRGTLSTPGNNLDLFFVQPVMPAKYSFDNDVRSTEFAGIYDTWQLPGEMAKSHAQLELYGLYVERSATANFPTEGTAREERYTVGGRLSANPKPFDFDIEPDYQFGDYGGGNISAWSIATEAGYTVANAPLSPRPFIGFDAASGDRTPHNGKLNTFDQLFPTGHLFFGYIDVIGRQNILDLHPGVELSLLKNQPYAKSLTLRTEYHQFWRESNQDAVYNVGGGVLRASAPNTSSPVGSEIDALLNWQITRHLSAYAGYSHFFAGSFIQQTGAHKDIDFFYTAATYKF